MAGDITLGALLGSNQSFDSGALMPWSKASDQASAYLVSSASAVHSSAFGLHTVADSTGGVTAIVTCALDGADAAAVAASGVTTHTVWSWLWARACDAPSSGQARWRVTADGDVWSAPIAQAAALQRYAVATFTTRPGGALDLALERVTGAGATVGIDLDDVLTQIDPLTLHPEWSLEEQSALMRSVQRTQSGKLQSVGWGSYHAFTVPLRWLTDAEADALNGWWAAQAPVAFSLDTSDSAAVWVCRITNSRQPIGKRLSPYSDRWAGTLTLESLDAGSLVF